MIYNPRIHPTHPQQVKDKSYIKILICESRNRNVDFTMFICKCCIYETKYKSNYTRHLNTKKHAKLSNINEVTICQLYKCTECHSKQYINPLQSCIAPIEHIEKLIKGFYKKPTTIPLLVEKETYKEKTDKLVDKYNSIYKSMFQEIQEIQETYGFPGRPFPSLSLPKNHR